MLQLLTKQMLQRVMCLAWSSLVISKNAKATTTVMIALSNFTEKIVRIFSILLVDHNVSHGSHPSSM